MIDVCTECKHDILGGSCPQFSPLDSGSGCANFKRRGKNAQDCTRCQNFTGYFRGCPDFVQVSGFPADCGGFEQVTDTTHCPKCKRWGFDVKAQKCPADTCRHGWNTICKECKHVRKADFGVYKCGVRWIMMKFWSTGKEEKLYRLCDEVNVDGCCRYYEHKLTPVAKRRKLRFYGPPCHSDIGPCNECAEKTRVTQKERKRT